MLSEGGPEYYIDQTMYYPPTTTTTDYGYVSTGFETPVDWDDHHRVFGLDGHETQYSGVQTESMPYVYYTPTYGYTQSPYNPYNPYIPGAIIGSDGSYMGSQVVTQQYYTVPSYEIPSSVQAYYPMVVQPAPEIISSNTNGPFNTNRANGGAGFKYNQSYTSGKIPAASRPASNHTHSYAGHNVGSSAMSATHGNTSQVFQGSKSSSHQYQVKGGLASSNNSSSIEQNAVVEKIQPNSDTSNVKYKDPKTNITNNSLTVKAYTTRAGETDSQGNIVIYRDRYNSDDFSVDYKNAKFFVIKSYSEDDVHKGVKYNVWSSTPNGNKKLQMMYEDAQRISAGEPRGCPIFLFFSVNASGQFCGVAEMTGRVDFYKDMDFWQQDKWSGCFPVKWHFVKDVPNISLRHIILEYNENKPVTNSRDTQEIRFKQGIEMLKIFKNHPSKTSLLDDFTYYENRQKIMLEERARLLMRNYGTSFNLVPALDPPRKQSFLVDTSLNKEKNGAIKLYEVKYSEKSADSSSLDAKKAKEDDVSSLKIGSLSLDPKQPVSRSLVGLSNTEEASKPIEVVTVGSMPVKVNGYAKSSGILTVGTIPLDPKALQPKGVGDVK